MKILITGGSGLLGNYLTKKLNEKGHEVAILSTQKKSFSNVRSFYWNPAKHEIDDEAITWPDGIFHLAGAGIVDQKWTNERKEVLIQSRVKTAQLLYERAAMKKKSYQFFISASGIGYYGTDEQNTVFNEQDAAGKDFVARLCVDWEAATKLFQDCCQQVAICRIGVVLAKEGGAFPKLSRPIKMCFGSPLGSGKQIVPWIHITDLCDLMYHLVKESISGIFNAVSSEHTNNEELTKCIADALNKPLWMPRVPPFVLQLLLGERADLVLKGNPISNEKIKATGFEFGKDSLKQAVESLI